VASGRGSWASAMALLAYAAGFSYAYTSLSAGTGALMLFGAVQVTMISYGLTWRAVALAASRRAWLGDFGWDCVGDPFFQTSCPSLIGQLRDTNPGLESPAVFRTGAKYLLT